MLKLLRKYSVTLLNSRKVCILAAWMLSTHLKIWGSLLSASIGKAFQGKTTPLKAADEGPSWEKTLIL